MVAARDSVSACAKQFVGKIGGNACQKRGVFTVYNTKVCAKLAAHFPKRVFEMLYASRARDISDRQNFQN
jgi:hypothetical protein